MRFLYSAHFKKRVKKQLSKNPSLNKKISKQLNLLKINPKYPSLKLHKLNGLRSGEYSIWIEGNIRITFIFVKKDIFFTDILNHDEY